VSDATQLASDASSQDPAVGLAGYAARGTGSRAPCGPSPSGLCGAVDSTHDAALQLIVVATSSLLRTVERFTDRDLEQESLLPGWTRGHVLAHVAQGADAMRNLLVWARTGVPVAAYASQQARDTAIETGARQGAGALLAELSASAERFRTEVTRLNERGWRQPVSVLGGAAFPAAQLLDRRLVEVELHHTDLHVGYGPEQWRPAFAEMLLAEPMRSQREDRRGPLP